MGTIPRRRMRSRLLQQKLSQQRRTMQALRDAVADAANVGAGLWFSYVFVLLYLSIAVGAITHLDLLLLNSVKLPFLNVELPLIGFFILGPFLLLIVQAYVLLHMVRLASKVGDFRTELQRQIAGEADKERLLRQLPSNVIVQFLAGPNEVAARLVQWLIAQSQSRIPPTRFVGLLPTPNFTLPQ